MCGIVGFISNKVINSESIIRSMSDEIEHRGPDSYGYFADTSSGIFLGFRRLSIIDLSDNGSQPISSFNKRFIMVFNGEIYNFKYLKKIINQKSNDLIKYKSHSDSEVLVNSFAVLGISETLKNINGQFAICLWDKKLKKFYLIRDRFGEKPLYYGFIDNTFVFASELKAMNKFPNFKKKISKRALNSYLKYLNVPGKFSIYEDIYKLLPSEVMELNVSNQNKKFLSENIKHYKYWDLVKESNEVSNQKIIKKSDYLYLTENILRKSILEQSYADVPIGSFLSGGIDSTLITALYQTQSSKKINTFTVGFENQNFDESIYAGKIANKLDTNHTKILLKESDAINLIEKLPEIYCEPFADSSQIPTFLLCREVKKYTTVALSGDGGDELFGGYNRYIWIKKVWSVISFFPKKIRYILSSLIVRISEENFDLLFNLLKKITFNLISISFAGQKIHRLAYRLKYTNTIEELYYLITTEWMDQDNILLNIEENYNKIDDSNLFFLKDFEDKMMIRDTLNYLPNDILVKTDRASMSNSMELRSPFLNKELFLLSRKLPLSSKIKNNQGKLVLKELIYKYIPKELVDRPKQGFSVPVDIWLNSSLRDWAESLLSERSLKDHGYFAIEPIKKKWSEHKDSKKNWGQSLWSILMFQQWYHKYK